MLYIIKNTYNRKNGKKIGELMLDKEEQDTENFYEKISNVLAKDIINNIIKTKS